MSELFDNCIPKYCIFSCIFHQQAFLDLYFLLLESYFLSNPNPPMNVHFVIYTTSVFKDIIQQSRFYNQNTFFFITNDEFQSVDLACKARLDVFDYSIINIYDKILYVDTDVVINGDIRNIFDIHLDEIIYALSEGSIDHEWDFWGSTLFRDRDGFDNYENKTAFSTGVMLFKNCDKIRNLFKTIKEDIVETNQIFCCCDQPYIVYNAFKLNLYNNQVLNSYAVNNDTNIYSGKIVHHFPGGVGIAERKLYIMIDFVNNMKNAIHH